MKIKKLILKNFRQFRDIELDFTDENGEVLDVVVFAGVNGSGKSTILNFLSEVLKSLNESNKLDKFIFEDSSITLELEIEILTKRFMELNEDEFGLIEREYDITLPKSNVFSISSKEYEEHKIYTLIKQFNKFIEINNIITKYFKQNKDWNENVISTDFFFLKNRGVGEVIINNQKREIDFLVTKDNIIKQIVQRVMDFRNATFDEISIGIINNVNKALSKLKTYTKIQDIEKGEILFSNNRKDKDLTFDDLSNGEKQLFYQTFTLQNLNLNNGILLIDEPEDAMHPTWQREILNVYKNIGENNQVFVATHSPHILSSVKPESLFVLNIDETTGEIQAFNMAKERKNTKGLDPNRILTEIMGAPLRDYETQERIDNLSALIRAANAAPNGNIQTIEDDLRNLTTDLGRQDYQIMRFNHELMLLKRKKSQISV